MKKATRPAALKAHGFSALYGTAEQDAEKRRSLSTRIAQRLKPTFILNALRDG